MGFMLEKVVPWGRSFDEYCAMFALGEHDLQKTILGIGDGPASFNAVLSERGGRVVSADPLYAFSGEQIRQRIEAIYDDMIEQVTVNAAYLRLERFGSASALGQARLRAMERFLRDYNNGKRQGRYLCAQLPSLPFTDRSFDLAVCSHLLFLYSEQMGLEFHLRSVTELCRIAGEVRIYPLLDLSHRTSRHLEPVLSRLAQAGLQADVESVDYEFQIGAKHMLRILTP